MNHKPASRQTRCGGEAATGQGRKFSGDGIKVTEGRGACRRGEDLRSA